MMSNNKRVHSFAHIHTNHFQKFTLAVAICFILIPTDEQSQKKSYWEGWRKRRLGSAELFFIFLSHSLFLSLSNTTAACCFQSLTPQLTPTTQQQKPPSQFSVPFCVCFFLLLFFIFLSSSSFFFFFLLFRYGWYFFLI